MNKIILIIIAVIIVILGGYFFLKGGYQTPTALTPTSTAPEVSAPEQGVGASEAKEITVVGAEFSFSPSVITVQAGQKIKLTFKNEGRASHNLVIERLGISTKTIGGGKTDIIEFTAPASGTYAIFCSVPGHRASGMEGSLKAE